MTLTGADRLELNRKVRAILVRHWIDLGRISIMVSPGAVRLRGSLCRLPGCETPLSSQIIEAMFRDIRMVQGISRVNGEFDNWKQDAPGCLWRQVEKEGLGKKAAKEKDLTHISESATPIDVSDIDSSYLS
ncbi:MAG: hypothetical protein EOM20_06290 [Spartobacteria bacterium]|nr:hypothetical protein [Spartobacteria bacterium]